MAHGGRFEVRLLGPVQLVGPDGAAIDVPSASQRRLLAVLALHSPAAVRSSWLCEMLDVTPGALRTSVARLRRILGPEILRTAAGAYRLDLAVDAARACEEIDAAAGDPDRLASVLGCWTGPTLAEFRDEAWAVGHTRRLDEVQASAVEDLAEIRLTHERPGRAIQELEAHIVEHPFRDRPRGLLMRALACSGRRTEALRAFQDYRDLLVATVGTEPTDELCAIERRIATGWGGVDPATPAPGERGEESTAHRHIDLDSALGATATGVGYQAALDRLASEAARAAADGTSVVLVSGPMGIGKTTLVADLARTDAASAPLGGPLRPM